MTQKKGFNPPPYPYDRLDELKPLGAHHQGGGLKPFFSVIQLSLKHHGQ